MNNEQRLKQVREAKAWLNTEPNAPKHFTKTGNEQSRETIDLALRFMEKMLGEPSGGMVKSGKHALLHSTEHCLVTAEHLAMVKQALKELEE